MAPRQWQHLGASGAVVIRRSFEERLWEKVDKAGDCWVWTAGRNPKGYGRIGRGGRGEGVVLAHRAVWELANGPVPEGLFVLHRCDNPPCVRPNHLFLGTKADNNQDMASKGRNRGQLVTHCPKGHRYTVRNTKPGSGPGRRRCRKCHNVGMRKLRSRNGTGEVS